MAVKIKLKRLGKIRNPQYRIVVADARTKREGRSIEEIGIYQPKEEPSLIRVDSERAQHWLSVGAQPTEPVLAILKITGDWQKFKGLPGAEGTLRTAPPRPDREAAFAAALSAAHATESGGEATSARRPRKAVAPGAGARAGTGPDAPTDTNPQESAAVEAVAQDPTRGGGELPEAAVAADSAPVADAGH